MSANKMLPLPGLELSKILIYKENFKTLKSSFKQGRDVQFHSNSLIGIRIRGIESLWLNKCGPVTFSAASSPTIGQPNLLLCMVDC